MGAPPGARGVDMWRGAGDRLRGGEEELRAGACLC